MSTTLVGNKAQAFFLTFFAYASTGQSALAKRKVDRDKAITSAQKRALPECHVSSRGP
jgi:hypothetical protein